MLTREQAIEKSQNPDLPWKKIREQLAAAGGIVFMADKRPGRIYAVAGDTVNYSCRVTSDDGETIYTHSHRQDIQQTCTIYGSVWVWWTFGIGCILITEDE